MSKQNHTASPHLADTSVRLVTLTNGGYAVVDADDFDRVKGFRWRKYRNRLLNRDAYYAQTRVSIGGGRRRFVLMHRLLLGLDHGDPHLVDHRNGDGLDNRRSNIRRATVHQNAVNRRCRALTASRFKGVWWDKRIGKWGASAGIPKARGRAVVLGRYAIEEEAAFAYNVAAPLLMDPAFVLLNEIADGAVADDRKTEIRRDVIARIKARLRGAKGRLKASSAFHGVSAYRKAGMWKALFQFNGKSAHIGYFRLESEAAFAVNCALEILPSRDVKRNQIPEDRRPDERRAEEIRQAIRARIAAMQAGHKGHHNKPSRFVGVAMDRRDSAWFAGVTFKGKRIALGRYPSEAECALAYNFGLTFLPPHALRKPNVIPDDLSPGRDAIDRIGQRVAEIMRDKLAGLNA